jgi:hypothetical protein
MVDTLFLRVGNDMEISLYLQAAFAAFGRLGGPISKYLPKERVSPIYFAH